MLDDRFQRGALTALSLSFLILFAALGIRMSFGAYVTAWETTFGVSRADISLISSVNFLLFGFSTPFAGKLVDRFGARTVFTASILLMGAGLVASSMAGAYWQLLIFYGVVASLGFTGASSLTASVAVMKWFPNRKGLAVGVLSCGIAAGGMILAPLTVYLIGDLGWRRTIFLLGAGCLALLCPLVWALFRDAPPSKGGGTGHSSGVGPAQNPAEGRWLLLITLAIALPYFVCGFTDLGLFSTHFVPMAGGMGFSTGLVALALSVDAAANLGGNLLAGHLADRVSITLLLGVMYLWRAAALSLLFFVTDGPSLLVFAALNGAVEASTIAPTAALCSKVYGPDKLGTFFGLVSAAHQLGGAAGAFLVGALFSRSQGYSVGIGVSVTLLVGAAAMTLFSGYMIRSRNALKARAAAE